MARWSNCFGSWTASNGDKYVGEYKDGRYNGQGTYTFANGDVYVGDFKDDKRHGQGAKYFFGDSKFKGDKYVGEYKDSKYNGQGVYFRADGKVGIGEWVDNKPDGRFIEYRADKTIERSGIYKEGTLVTSQSIDPSIFTRVARHSTSSVANEALKEEEKKSIRLAVQGSATQPDSNGDFTITIQTGTDTASLKIDGEELGGKRGGNYVIKRVARVGEQNTYTITARDIYGNTDTKTISVARQAVDSRPTFARLNPANIKPQPARDAVAIIIGIQNYKLIPKAEYASQDAQVFYDYASRALGIKQENIKLLLDDEADVSGILTAFQNWLPLKVRKGKTDVYVFYSGHGLPSPDGKSLFFLPVGANKDFVAKTAISQQEIVAGLKAAQPKSVTMFIDSCYSGQIRTGETLLASARPVVLTVQETAYPPDFTVITASASDQIASSSPDLKHGIFSYYLMKGLEGEADDKGDGTITIGKLQSYLAERVPRFAMTMSRKQEPQLTGDANRVLVAR